MFAKSAIIAAAAITAAVLGVVQSAPAQTFGADGDTTSVAVHYGDLDLTSRAGSQEMLQRIHQAATKVCGPAPTDRLSFQRQYDACVRETVARAVVAAGSPTMAAAGAPMVVAANDRH